MTPVIFHIDVNSAYLSWTAVEQLKNGAGTDLRMIPSIIGGDQKSRHGVVLAKSIPAKRYGIRTGEPVANAFRKCPNLVMEPPDHKMYREKSRMLMDYLRTFTKEIEQVINDWYPVIEKHNGDGQSRLVIIDDGSKDSTYEKLKQYAKTRPLLTPLTKPNGGHGATVLYGYKYALKNDADYIFQTDSDGQTLPEEFEPFWDHREKYDMVIGWRKERQDGASRVFVTKTLKLVIRICFGVTLTDANTPYRLMKAETMRKYIRLIPKNFNLSNVLLAVIYKKKGCTIKYLPITFRPRQGGVNSINMKKICKIGKQAVIDFMKLNKIIRNT